MTDFKRKALERRRVDLLDAFRALKVDIDKYNASCEARPPVQLGLELEEREREMHITAIKKAWSPE